MIDYGEWLRLNHPDLYEACQSNMKHKKINILGTEYTIIFQTSNENNKLSEYVGLTEFYSKKLIIKTVESFKSNMSLENINEFEKDTLRHEIMHAFFHESGLSDYTNDEVLIEWIALQFNKIRNVVEKLEAEGLL
jgi:hypothetical protein